MKNPSSPVPSVANWAPMPPPKNPPKSCMKLYCKEPAVASSTAGFPFGIFKKSTVYRPHFLLNCTSTRPTGCGSMPIYRRVVSGRLCSDTTAPNSSGEDRPVEKSILARAFRGELGPNDPTEGTALEPSKKHAKARHERYNLFVISLSTFCRNASIITLR